MYQPYKEEEMANETYEDEVPMEFTYNKDGRSF
jgi:hypothetical protein